MSVKVFDETRDIEPRLKWTMVEMSDPYALARIIGTVV